jgi:hypothetical protein
VEFSVVEQECLDVMLLLSATGIASASCVVVGF